ncbi:hypothetical protein ILUMI_22942, partial [Ignelater luminosus]
MKQIVPLTSKKKTRREKGINVKRVQTLEEKITYRRLLQEKREIIGNKSIEEGWKKIEQNMSQAPEKSMNKVNRKRKEWYDSE